MTEIAEEPRAPRGETITSDAAAGWYPVQGDGYGAKFRYWDGKQWTDYEVVGERPGETAETLGAAIAESNRYLYRIRKDIGFIALIMKIIVALWILGLVLLVLRLRRARVPLATTTASPRPDTRRHRDEGLVGGRMDPGKV